MTDDERYCSICHTDLEEDDDGYILRDGRLICRHCLQKNSIICENCKEYYHIEEMMSWDNEKWYCPRCFKKVFRLSVTGSEDAMAQEACQAMEARLKGRKTKAGEPGTVHIEEYPNESCYQSIDVWIDEDGRISKTERFRQSKICFSGEGSEDWVDIPDRTEDYAEDGAAEKLIRSKIMITDEKSISGTKAASVAKTKTKEKTEPPVKKTTKSSAKYDENGLRILNGVLRKAEENCESVVIPEGVESIYAGAFKECKKLKKVVCPNSLKTIGKSAFEGTPISEIDFAENLTKIGERAFALCRQLKKTVFGNHLTTLESEVFVGCIALETITLPESLIKIGPCAFSNCTALKEISLPNAVRKIEPKVFYGCTALKEISLPDGLLYIAGSAFENCNNLKELILPNELIYIDQFAFYNCASLSHVTFPASLQVIDRYAFTFCRRIGNANLTTGTVYVDETDIGASFADDVNVLGGRPGSASDTSVLPNARNAAMKKIEKAGPYVAEAKTTAAAKTTATTKTTAPKKTTTRTKATVTAKSTAEKKTTAAAKSTATTKTTAPKKTTTTTKTTATTKTTTAKKTTASKSQNKTEKTATKKPATQSNKPAKQPKRNDFFPAVTRNELLASMNKKKYSGVHDVKNGDEWISPRGLWAIKVPAGLSYTMDHTIAREMAKTAEGVGVKCDAQIRMTGHTGSSWSSKAYADPLDMMIVPTLGTLNIQAISNDLNQEWTMTAINAFLDEHGFELEDGALKYTSEIAVWYKAEQERLGTKDYIQMMFCVFCSGTTMVGGGLIVVAPRKLDELSELIMGMLRSITKVPQAADLDEFIPEILPGEFTLRFASSKDLQIENGVSLPIPDGFKGAIGSSGMIGSRKCSIIPEKLQFWNGKGDSSYIPLDISMMGMDSDDIPTTPEMIGKIAQQIIQQVAHLGVFNLNGPLYLVRQTAKSSVIYQELSDYGDTEGFALRVIVAVNNKVRICTVRIYVHKRIARSQYNLMLHEAGAMVAAYFQQMKIDGEELYDNGMAPAKSLKPGEAKEDITEHLELVNSPYYTTHRSADFRAQPIRELMRKNGNNTGKAFDLMNIKDDRYDLYRKATDIAKVFRLNTGLFDQYHDTEAMIRLGIIKEAHSLHALRSMAWTIAALSENEDREYDQFTFEELTRIGEDIRRARWLNYAVSGREERCKGLCDHEDWHVFYVPDQYLTSDSRKHEDLRILCGKENRGGNTISFSVPGLGMNSFSDKERIDEIISRNEETLTSLEELRSDLEDLLPVMETIYDGFMKGRDRSRELEGPLADILAAWCALSIAAKEPFYSEEAADTPEANAALDMPLKRPTDELPDNTSLRTQQKQNNARAMSDLEKVINDSEKILSEAQGSSDKDSVRKAEGLLEDLKNQTSATASALEIYEANQKKMEAERQERIAKAKAKGKSSKDESFMLALLEIEEAFGYLNRDINEFAERYAEDYPAYSAAQLIELWKTVRPRLHAPEMREAAKETILTCPVEERFEKITANCFNINPDWDFNARETVAIEKTGFWYNPDELDELRQLVKKQKADAIGSVNRQLTSFNPGWNSFTGVKNDLHITIQEQKEPIEKTHDLFDVSIGEGYHATVELKHPSMGYLTIPVMNLFASVWNTTPERIWNAAMANSMQDARGVSGRTRQDAEKAKNKALGQLRKSQNETKESIKQEANRSQTNPGSSSENRTSEENQKKQREAWKLTGQIATLVKERDAMKGLFAGFKRKKLQKQIDELKERLNKL